jgi:hypothetical protein
MPQGRDAVGGKTVQIKKAGTSTRGNEVDDGILLDNDVIAERAGRIMDPVRAPKGLQPDYTQSTIGSMRNEGEFRRR